MLSDLLQDTRRLQLVDNLDSANFEAQSKFAELLIQIRQAKFFLAEVLPQFELNDQQLNSIYLNITKAMIVSTLRLMGYVSDAKGLDEYLALINSEGYELGIHSIYQGDGWDLQAAAEKAAEESSIFEKELVQDTQNVESLLDDIAAERSMFVGLLSKGLILAFVKLNQRLGYMVEQGKITREKAEDILNKNIALMSVRRVSISTDISIPDSPDTKYELVAPPYLLEHIRQFVGAKLQKKENAVLIFDEAISAGRTFLGVMSYLIENFGEEVIEYVQFYTPGMVPQYIRPEDRRVWLADDSQNLMGRDMDETQFEHVWRVMMSDVGIPAMSLGLWPKNKEA